MLLSDDEEWRVHPGDCITHMLADMPERSVDMLVTSVPFPQIFAYSDLECDLGNSEGEPDMKVHFSYFFRGARRVLKPGRVAMIHCMQIPRAKRSGGQGLIDFRGLLIRLGQRAGLVYDYDWHLRAAPQAQAIRTRKWELKFQGLESDRSQSRGALGYYVVKFRAPGENTVPLDGKGEVTRNNWIDYAEGSWADIDEQDTLNFTEAKEEGDLRHVCPLQLGLIERLIRLYSDPGEIVFDPFAGVYSTGYVALGGVSPKKKRKLDNPRRFYGCEIKEGYRNLGEKHLARVLAQREASTRTLMDIAGI